MKEKAKTEGKPPKEPTPFGARIRAARKSAKLSGEKLGEKCGVTKGNVSQWENGLTEPNLTALATICRETKKSADYIVFGTEPEPPLPPEIADISRRLMAMRPDSRKLLFELFESKVKDENVELYAQAGKRK